jgi:uncharacterized membrane protein
MMLIDFFRNTWSKKIRTKDRFFFSLVLLVVMVFYFQSRYIQHGVSYTEYRWQVVTVLGFLVSFVVVDFWGNYILRLWLTVSGLFGKMVFFLCMFLVYFIILSPVFIVARFFKKKESAVQSNWSQKIYINKDYQSMG